jgi:release factor glutamine methyltransferase
MTPALLVRRAADYLERHGVDNPRITAELLLANVLEVDRSALATRTEGPTPQQARTFGRALCQRCAGTPTQHLTGVEGFRRMMLTVRPGVFIPRPETELLVELILDAIRDRPAPVVVDVGTGTGAIALAVADERRDARVLAVDDTGAAVALARENAVALGLAVEVLLGDLLAPLPASLRGVVDVVVSNPPYVRPEEVASLPAEVLADPETALVGGIELMERLCAEAMAWLRPGGTLAIEIGETQGDEVSQVVREAGLSDARVVTDLTGRDRFVVARRR